MAALRASYTSSDLSEYEGTDDVGLGLLDADAGLFDSPCRAISLCLSANVRNV